MNFAFQTFKPAATRVALVLLLAWVTLPVMATSRYVPSASGYEVTDSQTGLIWRRCAEGQSWSGSTCTGSASSLTWEGALTRARNQAAGSGQGWRLPNFKELNSLLQRNRTNPAMDVAAFPGAPSTYFWSATPYAGYASYVWTVDFAHGTVDYTSLISYHRAVRLVRDGE